MRALTTTLSLLILIGIGLGGLTVSDVRAQPPKAEGPKSYQGLAASLSIGTKECKADEPMEVTVTLTSATDAHRLFNPFLNGLLEQPGRIIVRDRDGKVVNRLLDFHGGSRRTPRETDYVQLPGGGFVGARLKVSPGRQAPGGDVLPPGDYTLQLVLHGSLLSLGGTEDAKEIVTTEPVAFRVVK
jgi:hypothetical protein